MRLVPKVVIRLELMPIYDVYEQTQLDIDCDVSDFIALFLNVRINELSEPGNKPMANFDRIF